MAAMTSRESSVITWIFADVIVYTLSHNTRICSQKVSRELSDYLHSILNLRNVLIVKYQSPTDDK